MLWMAANVDVFQLLSLFLDMNVHHVDKAAFIEGNAESVDLEEVES